MSILDTNPFDFSREEADQIIEMLEALYWKETLLQNLAATTGINRARIAWSRPAREIIRDLLQLGAEDGRVRVLIERVRNNADSQAYHEFIDSLLDEREAATTSPNGFRAHFLGAGFSRSFVDRAALRTFLEELVAEGGPRVLVVTGPKQSGKTHTWRLINHIARSQGFKARRFDLDDWAPVPPKPGELMKNIAAQLRLEGVPEVDGNAPIETQARLLTNWFIGEMADRDDRCWLVFDSLDRAAVRKESLFLVENLAEAAERDQLGMTRVVLLGFTDVMSPDVERASRREDLGEQAIAQPQVESFLTEMAQELGAEIEGEALQLAVATVMEASLVGDELDLVKLGESVEVVAAALFGEA